jgi:hypothetical protein
MLDDVSSIKACRMLVSTKLFVVFSDAGGFKWQAQGSAPNCVRGRGPPWGARTLKGAARAHFTECRLVLL